MRKKALGIIGGVVLVAALGTASFFLLRNTPEEDSSSVSSSDSSEESISLTSEDPNDVTSIDITNGSGSFAVVRTAEGTGTGDDHAAYAVSGWEDLPMDTSTLWTLSNNTASMEANGVVEENCSDLEKFGLDDAEAIAVTLHFADGSDYSFRVGNAAADASNTWKQYPWALLSPRPSFPRSPDRSHPHRSASHNSTPFPYRSPHLFR